jgi:serine/threonine protein kinase
MSDEIRNVPSFDFRTALLPPDAERYVIEKRLGVGGMGVVDQVRDRSLGRSVAMKQLKADRCLDEDAIGELLLEARIAGRLDHPNIIPVHDVGVHKDGQPYYTMRLLDALSLREVMAALASGNPEAHRTYPLRRLLRMFQALCMGVEYAHSQEAIHRDLKPDNIRLGRYGEVQIVDWGLARVEGLPDLPLRRATMAALADGKSNPCIVIGSPSYMSPEQAGGHNDRVGPASDIYAMGCIFYEMLTLEVPFAHNDTEVLLTQIERDPIVAPSKRTPDRPIPSVLEDLCMASLEKDTVSRIQDPRILWWGIEEFL